MAFACSLEAWSHGATCKQHVFYFFPISEATRAASTTCVHQDDQFERSERITKFTMLCGCNLDGLFVKKAHPLPQLQGFLIFQQLLKVHSRLKFLPQRIQTKAHTVDLAPKKCFSDSQNKLKTAFLMRRDCCLSRETHQ